MASHETDAICQQSVELIHRWASERWCWWTTGDATLHFCISLWKFYSDFLWRQWPYHQVFDQNGSFSRTADKVLICPYTISYQWLISCSLRIHGIRSTQECGQCVWSSRWDPSSSLLLKLSTRNPPLRWFTEPGCVTLRQRSAAGAGTPRPSKLCPAAEVQ